MAAFSRVRIGLTILKYEIEEKHNFLKAWASTPALKFPNLDEIVNLLFPDQWKNHSEAVDSSAPVLNCQGCNG